MAVTVYRCPSCQKIYDFTVFVCPDCEAIVNHTLIESAPKPPKEPTVIRRMLSPTDAGLEKPEATYPGKEPVPKRTEVTSPTVVMPYPEPRDGVPSLRTDIDLRDLQLTVYEAFVVSRVDGSTTVDALRSELGLSKLEISVVLGTLKEKGIVHVHEPTTGPKSAPPRASQVPTLDPAFLTPLAEEPNPAPASVPPPRAASTSEPPPPASRPTLRPVPPPARRATAPKRKLVLGAPGTERLDGAGPAGFEMLPKRESVAAPEGPLQEAIRLEKFGDLAGAIRVLEKAITSSRAPAALYNRLAIALVKEKRDYFRAEELLNKALALEPGNSSYSNNLAKVLMMIASYSGLVPIPDDVKKW
ncbi:MAG: hypothetical protein ABIJ09_09455 [Pseudomonadota bacterium]